MFEQRKGARLALCGVAIVCALASNYFFTGESLSRFHETFAAIWGARQILGTVFLVLAAAFAAWALDRRHDYAVQLLPRAADASSAPLPPPPSLRGWTLAPAGLAYLAATFVYLARGETSLVHWLWISSMVLLVVPLVRTLDLRDFWPMAAWEFFLLLLILVAAFVLRYLRLTEIPLHVDNDVSIMGLFSRKLLETGNHAWVGMAKTNHHFSEHQYHALSMRLFGQDHYGLSMFSVIAGTATCALVYFYGRLLFNRATGFLGAVFLAFNYVHIHFSRIIFGPLSTFWVALAGLLLLHGLRRRSPLSFALAGLSFGAGLMGYYSARIGPVLLIALFCVWWLQRRGRVTVPISYWAIALAGMLCTFGPNLAYALTHFDKFSGRGNEVILWTKPAWTHLSAKYQSGGDALVVLKEQVKRALLAPFYFPDESTICYLRKPMLGAFTALGCMLGLGFLCRRLRDLSLLFLLFWIGATFVLGGVLTIDPPFWPHLNIAIPALSLVAALGVERVARSFTEAGGARIGALVVLCVSAVVVFSGVHEWEIYQQFARQHATTRIHAMRQIRELPRDFRSYLVSRDTSWHQETFQFFTPHADGHDLPEAELLKRIPPIEKPTAFFVFAEVEPRCLEVLHQAFPNAVRHAYWDGWGWPAFTVVKVYPPHYVLGAQAALPPVKSLWAMPGWRWIAGLVVGLLLLGWMTLRREWVRTTPASDRADPAHG